MREAQRLVKRIVALSQFIFRLTDWGLPFFRVLRKAARFQWDDQCEHDFQELKQYLACIPTLSRPNMGETLWIYLVVSEGVVSSILLCQEGPQQQPIYYTSHILKGAELCYSELEKLAYALVLTAWRLQLYFLAHPVIMLTSNELGRVLTRLNFSGWLAKWTMELTEYNIHYQPRTAIKAQALAYFLVELPNPKLMDSKMVEGPQSVW